MADLAWWRRPHTWLIVVAVLHGLSPLILMGTHWWFGIDETVYLSQLNAHVPAGLFSAPRARGTTFVAAPVTLLTSSVSAVRIWVAAVSGLALYGAFRPWLRLRPGWVVPLAALLFSTVWSVIFYGFEVMPNEWVAYATLAATGFLVRYVLHARRRDLTAVVVAIAVVGLLRPSDAAYAGAGLVACCVFVRAAPRRRVLAAAAVVVGGALGLSEWVIEAYTSYGGLAARIHAAQGENGGGGLHFAGAAQARALAGPVLCRAGCHAHAGLVYRLWWIVAALLLVVAVVACRRVERPMLDMVPLLVGAAAAAQYVFAVTYAAPRFLIPAYLLLSLPVASGMLHVVGWVRSRRLRAWTVGVLAVGIAAQIVIQVHVITALIEPRARLANGALLIRADTLRDLGLHGPCLVLGSTGNNQDLAYATGCTNVPRTPALIAARLRDGTQVVWLTPRRPARRYGVSWLRVPLPGARWWGSPVAYLSMPARV